MKRQVKLILFFLRLQVLFLVAILFLTTGSQAKAVSGELKADKNFSRSKLPADAKVWYDRLWQAIDSRSLYPNPYTSIRNAGKPVDDTYKIGRVTVPYVYTLLAVFRTTGDPAILEELDDLMQSARSTLVDKNGDGFEWWVFLQDPNSAYYYNKEHRSIDDHLILPGIAEFAYALRLNQDLDPKYKAHADFWVNFLKKDWEQYNGGQLPVKDRDFMHTYASSSTYYYYMYKLTGNSQYLEIANSRFNKIHGQMKTLSTETGKAFVWDHRGILSSSTLFGCQRTWYAHGVVMQFQDMYWNQFSRFKDLSYLNYYITTARDLVFDRISNPSQDFANGTVCDGYSVSGFGKNGGSPQTIDTFLGNAGGFMMLAPFDKTGKITKHLEYVWQKQNAKAKKSYFLMAALFQAKMAENNRFPTPTGGTQSIPKPAPTPIPTATPKPTPTPTPKPTTTPVVTPKPTATPKATPKSTSTPKPTSTPQSAANQKTADSNGDNKIDGVDYVIFLLNYKTNTNKGAVSGDFNADSRVNMDDYRYWLESLKL